MADDRLNGVTALLALSLDSSDAAFLTCDNDLGVIDAMTAIAQVDIGLIGFCPGEPLDLCQDGSERVPIIRTSMMRLGADDEVTGAGGGDAGLAAELVFLVCPWRYIQPPAHAMNKLCSALFD